MKIIHTADWHIGAELYGHDRSADHIAFFEQLTALMSSEHPDALVVSGDIFDRVLPTHAAQKLYTDAILQLHEASPDTEIVITAGNHDSAARLELTRPLWAHFRVHVVGFIERNGDEVNREKHIIYIPDKGYIIALPFVYQHAYPAVEEDGQDRQKAYINSLIQLVEERNSANLSIVLMAHLAVAGSDFMGHKEHDALVSGEKRSTVGNIEVVTFAELGSGYDYLALGHIHRPQVIRGSGDRAYYSGSPIAVGFDEVFPHSVSLVEVKRGESPEVTQIPIHPLRKLKTIPDHPAAIDEVVRQLESSLADDEEVFVRVNLSVDGIVPIGADTRIADVFSTKPNAVYCTTKYTDTRAAEHTAAGQVEMYESVRENNPVEIAMEYMTGRVDEEMREEYGHMIDELWQKVIREESER